MSERKEIRIDDILGRELLAGNNQPVGRIEEFRVERVGQQYVVREVVIGLAGVLERLDVGARLVIGQPTHARVARWDQIDFSNPVKPKLIVSISELVTT